jgi:hypothetical protein
LKILLVPIFLFVISSYANAWLICSDSVTPVSMAKRTCLQGSEEQRLFLFILNDNAWKMYSQPKKIDEGRVNKTFVYLNSESSELPAATVVENGNDFIETLQVTSGNLKFEAREFKTVESIHQQ